MVSPPPIHPLFAHTSPGLFIDYVNLKKKPYYVRISLIFVGGDTQIRMSMFPQKKKKKKNGTIFGFYFVTKKAIDFSNLNGATWQMGAAAMLLFFHHYIGDCDFDFMCFICDDE